MIETPKFCMITTLATKKEGLGHLSRSMLLYNLLESFGHRSVILLETDMNKDSLPLALQSTHYFIVTSVKEEIQFLDKHKEQCDFLFIDKRDTNLQTYKNYPAITIGIDNLGEDRDWLDITYDPLPHFNPIESNIQGSQYLLMPPYLSLLQNNAPLHKDPLILLVSFGGSDPYDLSFSFLNMMDQIKMPLFLHIVLGPLYRGKITEGNILGQIKHSIKIHRHLSSKELHTLASNSHIVVTAFGLTAFECLMIQKPVFLVNHTSYHLQLSQAAKIPHSCVTAEQISEKGSVLLKEELEQFLKHPQIPSIALPNYGNEPLLTLLKKILNLRKKACACKKPHKIIKRSLYFTVYECLDKPGTLSWN